MPVISRLISIILRIGELAFGAVVAGIIGSYLDNHPPSGTLPRFIYTVVVAGISMLLALLWLVPFSAGFHSWPIDFLLSLAWFGAFGVLLNYNRRVGCTGSAFNWSGLTSRNFCSRFRAAQAFSFLSAVFWLVSAILGIWFIQSERRKAREHGTAAPTGVMSGTGTAVARPEEAGNVARPAKQP